jgi:hypothetical protein
MIKLPKNINYKRYESTQGMSTKLFGPGAWIFLFSSIMGRFPIKIDPSNAEHQVILHSFRQLFTSLDNLLPCVFCRNSFSQFLKELPIEPFLIGRIELMYWLYLMKDKVNKKLIKQEKECYKTAKQKLKKRLDHKKITKETYKKMLETLKKNTFKTIPSPPFKKILDFYEARRGKCNKQKKTC